MKCPECGHANPDEANQCAKCGGSIDREEDGGSTAIRPAANNELDDDSETGFRPAGSHGFDSESKTGFRPPAAEEFDEESETGVHPPPSRAADDSAVTGVRPTPPSGLSRAGTYLGSGASSAIPTYDSFGERYEILELLGEGGMGRVYKAWDRELEKVIALKTIRGEHASNPEVLRRFKQELLLARKITHKNVIRIHDMGEAGGVRFFTMEYIPGDSLKERIEKRGKLPTEQAVSMAKQILGALAEAHEQGVVHRDLKPQNIMIDQEEMLHIMDFGIARSAQDTGMTATGTVMGTPDYMSPEQVKGEKADAQADLFSFGIILYEMLTGTLPYQADTTAAKVMMRLSKKPKPPREIDEQIPKYLESIVLKCLEVDRELRYRSAKEILEDIEREQVDRSPGARLKRTLVRRKGTVAAAVVLAASIGTAVYFAVRAGPAPAAIEAPTVLAIVPFSNGSGDPALDWLGPSLAEILTTEVGQSARLRTVATERVNQILNDLRVAPGSRIDPTMLARVAEFTEASSVVSGQYLKFGNQIRIDATVQDLEGNHTVQLKAEAPNEDALLDTIRELANQVQANLGLSRDIVEELRAASFRYSSESIQALAHYHQGEDLAGQGRDVEALQEFQAATEEDPRFALAWAALAETHAKLGYDYESEEDIRTAVDLSANVSQQERYLIDAMQARILKDFDKAIESYENLVTVMPENTEVQFRLAQLYEEKTDYDRARELFDQVLQHDPNYLAALLAVGNLEIERGNTQQAFEPLNQALSVSIQLANKEAQGNALFALGLAYSKLSRNDEALRNFQNALAVYTEVSDKRGMAETLKEIGKIEWAAGKVSEAETEYEKALELQTEIGDRLGSARVLLTLGDIQDRQGEHAKALELFKQSLKTLRELDDKHLEAVCLSYIGSLYLEQGNLGEAQTYLELVLQIREQMGSKGELSETVHNLGELALQSGRYNEAIDRYLRSLELSRDAGDELGVAIESHSLGAAFAYQGRLGAALKANEDAMESVEKAGEGGFWRATILRGYGDTLNRIGRFDEGKKTLEDALTLARQLDVPLLIIQTLNFMGESALYQGTLGTARKPLEESLRAASDQEDSKLALPAQVNLATLDLEEERDSSRLTPIIERLTQLVATTDSAGAKYYTAEASIALAEAHQRAGQFEEARHTLDELLRLASRSGLRIHTAKAHFLLGVGARHEGNEAEMQRHFREAVRILDELKSEAGTDTFLQRADLARIYKESQGPAAAQQAGQ